MDRAQHLALVAKALLGEPNARLSSATEWRYGTRGSLAIDLEKGVWHDHETGEGGGVLPLIHRQKGIQGREAIEWMKREGLLNDHANGFDDREVKRKRKGGSPDRTSFSIVETYDYIDSDGTLLYQVCRQDPKDFRQRRPNGRGWTWNVKGVRAIPYRLVEIDEKMAEDRTIFIVEGEKDADALWAIGAPATTNSGGAGKWQPELAKYFRGVNVIILPDNDQLGRAHARKVAKALCGTAANVRILQLPGLPPKGGDVSDWIDAGGTIEALNELVETRAKVFTKGNGSDFAPTEDREGVPKAKPTIERPVIMVSAGELPRMVDEAEQALLDARVPVFSRGGILVSPVSEEVPAADDRTTTIVRLREIRLDNMIDNLARFADFRRASKEGSVAVDPPARVASILLARDGSWRFPKIAGVITTPTLRPNGSLLDKPGYDEATRLYLKPDRGLRLRIKDEPSVDDARVALQLLKDLLVGFPFANPVDRTVAISAIVTAVLRGAMSVAPLHLIRAHCAGTGKSHLVDVAASIATGRRCPVITAGKTLEETEKRLGSQLLAATPIVSIDNAVADLGGDMLCQVTERPLIRVRVLGKSETPELECRSMVFATGNNVSVFGDMTRRAVICNLDANVERPELRSFQFDPIHRVMADRGTFVAAAITIALAYRAAKMPEVCGPIGSYGEWSRLVRAPLIWLGDEDPAKSMELARDEDPELAAIHQLFTLWPECLSLTSPYTTKQIIEAATKHSEFRELLMLQAGDAREIVSKRLGRWLTKITGRVVNGHRLTMAEGKGRGNRYALLPPDTQLKV